MMGTKLLGFEEANGRARAVATSAGELECDVAVVCLHKLPNTSLASSSGSSSAPPERSWSTTTCARRLRAYGRPAT